MKTENRKKIILRYSVVIFFILLLGTAIAIKLVDTTIVSADKWNEKANARLNRFDTISPLRGNILAADGSILATNLRHYTVRMDYTASKFNRDLLEDTIAALADSMTMLFPSKTAAQWQDYLLEPLSRKKLPKGFRVVDNISHADYQRMLGFPFFSQRNRNKSGMVKEAKMKRINPYGSMARRSIGRVGATSLSKEIHGRSGLEMALDHLLYGTPGYAKKIALTHAIVNWADVKPVNGYNIQTTIDIKMQDIVENELNSMLEQTRADWGVAVLMDVETGDIKAISNLEIDPDGDGYTEGMNYAVVGFEPGSVIKAVSMLIALENGAVTPNTVIATPSPYHYAGGKPIRDCSPVASMPAYEVCERSSNIGMTRIIASKYENQPGQFYSALKKIGFLEPLNVGIGGERAPRIDSLGTGAGARIALSRQCYGYATEIPPLHTLAMYNAIANGGKFVRPRLVQRIFGAGLDSIVPVTYVRNRVCSEANARTLRQMLARVVDGPHGTARVLRNDDVSIAGKTGTALVIENGQYTHKTRLAFCGFFPVEQPRYSCIVLISNPRNGAGAARTSGIVLKNVATRLYSRGFLDSSTSLAQNKSANFPTIYASPKADEKESVSKALGIGGKRKVLAKGSTVEKGVPAVKGFSLRNAIAVLEEAGYNVAINGSGCVESQNPAPGTLARTGSTVHLSLRN